MYNTIDNVTLAFFNDLRKLIEKHHISYTYNKQYITKELKEDGDVIGEIYGYTLSFTHDNVVTEVTCYELFECDKKYNQAIRNAMNKQ